VTDPALAERYVRLGLRLGRHVDGLVDAYFGPQELAAAAEAEEPVVPTRLVAEADALLDELEDGWLRDQAAGLRTYAGVLAGEARSYPDEVEGCYGVPPTWTDESVFEAAQAKLDELLPGDGTIGDRHRRWEESIRVPTEKIGPTTAAVIEEARRQTRDLVGLPDGEGVELEVVHDEAWWAFCAYEGELQSRIEVNVDLPMTAPDLLRVAIHETYPGHHAERCNKEQLLVRERGLLEETIVMVPAPQSLVAEGIAVLAPSLLLEGEGGDRLAELVRDAGVDFDLDQALAIDRAARPCRWAEVNAGLMLHDRGASEDETQAYVERWALLGPEMASHIVRFLQQPTSRTYIVTYLAGHELCASYVAGDPERFRRLLTQQVRVGDLLDVSSASAAS
jgi:hypothetical protein